MDLTPTTASATASQSAASSSAFSQLTDNFDTFLTLLTTQLQNQDPLEPLDTEQFTQQLVQFAGVEQSIQTNANLETLIELQSAVQRDEALGLVGRVVAVEGGETVLSPARNDRTTRFDYTVPANTRSVRLEIIDSQGEVISTLDAEQRAGRHAVVWPGTTSNGNTAADGTYRLRARRKRRGDADRAFRANAQPHQCGRSEFGCGATRRGGASYRPVGNPRSEYRVLGAQHGVFRIICHRRFRGAGPGHRS